MKKAFFGAVASLGLLTGAAHASTVDFDFVALADNFKAVNGYEADWTQATGGSLSSGGVSVTATATYVGGTAHAFLDASDRSGPAGLGVCHSGYTLSGNSNCATGGGGSNQSDDNITEDETLFLQFSKAVSILDILFYDAKHKLANGTLLINGVGYNLTGGSLDGGFAQLGTEETFSFAYGGAAPTQVYLGSASVSPVPLPAGVVLLLTAVGGLGALRMRRKTA